MPSPTSDPKDGLLHLTLRRISTIDDETKRLARRVARQRFDSRKLSPERLKTWMDRIVKDFVNAGEAEYGPDYGATVKRK